MAFSEPGRLFSALARDNLGPPVLYGVLTGTFVGVVSILWHMLFIGTVMLAEGANAGEFAIGTGLYALVLCLTPLFTLIGLFISAALYHVSLLILGDGQHGFAVSFRALAYGNTPALLAILPFCGGFAGGLWSMVLVIMAFKLGHATDWWRAILAYFLPSILCCCLLGWLLMSFGLLGALGG
jgi:hypothetical protein